MNSDYDANMFGDGTEEYGDGQFGDGDSGLDETGRPADPDGGFAGGSAGPQFASSKGGGDGVTPSGGLCSGLKAVDKINANSATIDYDTKAPEDRKKSAAWLH